MAKVDLRAITHREKIIFTDASVTLKENNPFNTLLDTLQAARFYEHIPDNTIVQARGIVERLRTWYDKPCVATVPEVIDELLFYRTKIEQEQARLQAAAYRKQIAGFETVTTVHELLNNFIGNYNTLLERMKTKSINNVPRKTRQIVEELGRLEGITSNVHSIHGDEALVAAAIKQSLTTSAAGILTRDSDIAKLVAVTREILFTDPAAREHLRRKPIRVYQSAAKEAIQCYDTLTAQTKETRLHEEAKKEYAKRILTSLE